MALKEIYILLNSQRWMVKINLCLIHAPLLLDKLYKLILIVKVITFIMIVNR